jgi:hypothetical protein
MRKFIGAALLAAILLTGSPALKAQVAVGISIGAPPPPRVLRVRPVAPGPGYIWVDGYWLLDSATLRRGRLDRTTLGRGPLLQRLLEWRPWPLRA